MIQENTSISTNDLVSFWDSMSEVIIDSQRLDHSLTRQLREVKNMAGRRLWRHLSFQFIRTWPHWVGKMNESDPKEIAQERILKGILKYLNALKIVIPPPYQYFNKQVNAPLEIDTWIEEFKALFPTILIEDLKGIDTGLDLKHMFEDAPVFLRLNSNSIDDKEATRLWTNAGLNIEKNKKAPYAYRVLNPEMLGKAGVMDKGLWEVQDINAQYICSKLMKDCRPQYIIDACAGNGGKTLAIADLLKGKGKIEAWDVSERKLKELKRRAVLAGYHNINTKVNPRGKFYESFVGKADMVVMDVPCSGSGVWRRNPDIMWRTNSKMLDELLLKQRTILAYYSPLIRPGGYLAYITCSLFKKECESQINYFLKDKPDWSRVHEEYFIPGPNEGDGFYFALLKRII